MHRKSPNKHYELISAESNETASDGDIFTDRVSLEQMRSIWNDEEVTYSDEQLITIREWLYAIANVIIEKQHKKTSTNIIEIKAKTNEAEESNIIRKGEYRRAS